MPRPVTDAWLNPTKGVNAIAVANANRTMVLTLIALLLCVLRAPVSALRTYVMEQATTNSNQCILTIGVKPAAALNNCQTQGGCLALLGYRFAPRLRDIRD